MKDQVLSVIADLLAVRSKLGEYADRSKLKAAVALLHAIIADPPVAGVKVSPPPPNPD